MYGMENNPQEKVDTATLSSSESEKESTTVPRRYNTVDRDTLEHFKALIDNLDTPQLQVIIEPLDKQFDAQECRVI